MIGTKIRTLRIQARMTQPQLAQALNLSRNSINNWELNLSAPTIANLVQLTNIFGVSSDYLLGIEQRDVLYLDDLNDEDQRMVRMLAQRLKNN